MAKTSAVTFGSHNEPRIHKPKGLFMCFAQDNFIAAKLRKPQTREILLEC